MTPPDPLLELFSRYNPAVWPIQVVAWVAAVILLVAIVARPSRATDRAMVAFLALTWAFIGIVFQAAWVRELDATLAVVYAAGFIVHAVLLAHAGIHDRLSFRADTSPTGLVGWAAIGYALVVYPLIGIALGHPYPAAPLFGAAPCPTTIFTVGAMLLARPPVPKRLLVMPLAWAVVATPAAVGRGVHEDIALLGFAVLGTALLVARDARLGRVHRGERTLQRAA